MLCQSFFRPTIKLISFLMQIYEFFVLKAHSFISPPFSLSLSLSSDRVRIKDSWYTSQRAYSYQREPIIWNVYVLILRSINHSPILLISDYTGSVRVQVRLMLCIRRARVEYLQHLRDNQHMHACMLTNWRHMHRVHCNATVKHAVELIQPLNPSRRRLWSPSVAPILYSVAAAMFSIYTRSYSCPHLPSCRMTCQSQYIYVYISHQALHLL
jgi:hypothetical protein